jgi:hypothetical protein
MQNQDSRAGQLNAVIDPKLLFLAKVAARYKGQRLVEFIEDAFRHALSPAAMSVDEPTYGHETKPEAEASLWFESLWHEDDAVRLYHVAMADTDLNLLTPKQRDIFNHVTNSLIKQRKKVTLKSFVAFFDASERSE